MWLPGISPWVRAFTLACAVGSATKGVGAPAEASRVLFLGDSLSIGYFGFAVDQTLRARPDLELWSVLACGSHPWSWIRTTGPGKTTCGYFEKRDGREDRAEYNPLVKRAPLRAIPKLEAMLKEFRPRLVILQQGSNFLEGLQAGDAKNMARAIAQLRDEVLGDPRKPVRRCLWVLPPDARRFGKELQQRLYDLVAANAKGCVLFDSRTVTAYPATGGDGEHYESRATADMMRLWAREVVAEALRLLR